MNFCKYVRATTDAQQYFFELISELIQSSKLIIAFAVTLVILFDVQFRLYRKN